MGVTQVFNGLCRKMEQSPVAEHFNGEGHTLPDVIVMAINKIYSHDSFSARYEKAGGSGPWGPHILRE